jgi:hypothetical protein
MLLSSARGGENMSSRTDAITVEGIVQKDFLDAIHLSHRVCIAAKDGHTYEVEPSYVGLYLERFVGHRVVARVQPVTNGKQRSVVRIVSLRVLDKKPAEAASETRCRVFRHRADNEEQVLCSLGLGETET